MHTDVGGSQRSTEQLAFSSVNRLRSSDCRHGRRENNHSPSVSGCWPVRSDLVYLLLAEEVAEYWLRDQIPRPPSLFLRHFRELQDQ